MDWRMITRAEDQSVMLKNAKFGRYVAAFCAGFMQGGLFCYCVVTWFSTQIVYVGNETRTVHILPCAVYKKLLSADTSPMNEIVLCLAVFVGCHCELKRSGSSQSGCGLHGSCLRSAECPCELDY